MSEKQNFSEFEKIGDEPKPVRADQKVAPKKTSKNVSPRGAIIGCFGIFIVIFVLLLVSMVFGLRAGDEVIKGFGLDPVLFKNWTINLVSLFFGAFAVWFLIAFFWEAGRRFLAEKNEFDLKKRATKLSTIFLVAFVGVLILWYLIYLYISQFEVKANEPKVEILSAPGVTTSLTSPVTVDFSAERITEAFSQKVGDRVYNPIVSYEWDRDGDGDVDATGEKVSLYFRDGGKNNGLYNVTLRTKMISGEGNVVNGENQKDGNSQNLISKEYVKVVSISNQEIYGEIEANPESGNAPLSVRLTAKEIADPQKSPIISYKWYFDDSEEPEFDGNYQSVNKTFEKIGEHKVRLVVTSEDFVENGIHETKEFTKIIPAYEGDLGDATATMNISPKNGLAPLVVSFDGSESARGSDIKVEKYEWLIGDGLAKLNGARARYTFKQAGVFPVVLRVIYENGQVRTATDEIRVNSKEFAPQAVLKTNPSYDLRKRAVAGAAPLLVEFDGGDSKDRDNNIIAYDWDFNGDRIWDAEGSSAEYEFIDPGEYISTLRIVDADDNESEATIKIIVAEEIAKIDFGIQQTSGPAPLKINFDASGSRLPGDKKIVSYEWNFNSGITDVRDRQPPFVSPRAQVSHIFENVGEYVVQLTLHAADGDEYSSTTKIIATEEPLSAYFTASRLSGSAPLAVTFDASESSGGEIKMLVWDFGDDKNMTNEVEAVHLFDEPGEYEVVLNLYDYHGNVSQYFRTVTVSE